MAKSEKRDVNWTREKMKTVQLNNRSQPLVDMDCAIMNE
jgi:hypothetical protein